jgi:hypothetical protein
MTVLVKPRLPKKGKGHQLVKLNLESRLSDIVCTCI